jgi:hypothetical protein
LTAAEPEDAALAGRDLVLVAERHGDEADDGHDENGGDEEHGRDARDAAHAHLVAADGAGERLLVGGLGALLRFGLDE